MSDCGSKIVSLPALDEAQLTRIAIELAGQVGSGGVIHLNGPLGAGKTTFARALLQALGVGARVKSPTYSLIESYSAVGLAIHHLDLYRIAATDELEWLGLADLDQAATLWLIEWPERAGGAIPRADLAVELAHAGETRNLRLRAETVKGADWLAGLHRSNYRTAS